MRDEVAPPAIERLPILMIALGSFAFSGCVTFVLTALGVFINEVPLLMTHGAGRAGKWSPRMLARSRARLDRLGACFHFFA
ncbi:hypothetical protein [Leisingera aquaemixtae]|uniref:hypothetical protein n=1 Tax=Leisingera aquaemixtae TaxID=1396826 RepID=UPI0021A6A738|nr:hypothetical protein [Leisingera aquaemixtae]UWQ44984.1 hypothetical protein K3719_14510 [Leisingera aquaemixtae]